MFSILPRGMLANLVAVAILFSLIANFAMSAPMASIGLGEDAAFASFTGISNPPTGFPNIGIAISDGSPGYLNQITGGPNGGATGAIGIVDPYLSDNEIVALAVHVTDNAGTSHSLSSLGDPALTDIVADLNSSPFDSSRLTAYPFGSPPQQYSAQVGALSSGELANGGQPFDILVVEFYRFPGSPDFLNWSFDFHQEIGNPDGITSLSITDVGAIPEPSAPCIALLSGVVFLCRRTRIERQHVPGAVKGDIHNIDDFHRAG